MEKVRLLTQVVVLATAVGVAQVGYPPARAHAASMNVEMAQAQTDTPPATAPASTPPTASTSSPPSGAATPSADKPANSPDSASPATTLIFPDAIDPKYIHEPGIISHMRTCAEQFTANKATNANGGMKWIDRSGGYYRACVKHLKG